MEPARVTFAPLSSASNERCGICWNNLSNGWPVVAHNRGGEKHPIHNLCMKKFLEVKESSTCITCEAPIDPASLSYSLKDKLILLKELGVCGAIKSVAKKILSTTSTILTATACKIIKTVSKVTPPEELFFAVPETVGALIGFLTRSLIGEIAGSILMLSLMQKCRIVSPQKRRLIKKLGVVQAGFIGGVVSGVILETTFKVTEIATQVLSIATMSKQGQILTMLLMTIPVNLGLMFTTGPTLKWVLKPMINEES